MEVDTRHLILGCIIAGSTVVVLALAVNASKDRARLRRQEILIQAVERMLLLVRQIRNETHTDPELGKEGAT